MLSSPSSRLRLVTVIILAALSSLVYFSHASFERRARLKADFGESASTVYLQIASTPEERRKGLMFVRHLEDDSGMLFVMAKSEPQSFWMKNVPISLDLIGINEELRVVSIIPQAIPESTTPLRMVENTLYVVELKGGMAVKKGIAVGDKITFHGPVPLGIADNFDDSGKNGDRG